MLLSPSPTVTSSVPVGRGVRYVGIDLARFVAITGMMAAHLLSLPLMLPGASGFEQGLAESLNIITNGAPAALFAVLGGLSIVFATRRQLREGHRWKASASVAVRGIVLIVLGLLLGFVDNSIVVILVYYGLSMLLISPLIAVRGWVLAVIAVLLGLGAGWLNALLRRALQVAVEGPHISFDFFFQDPVVAVRTLLITGEYPVVTWACYLLSGILIGRMLVAAAARGALGRTAAALAAIGATVAIAAQLVSEWTLANLVTLGILQEAEFFQAAQMQLMHFGGSGGNPSTSPLAQLIAIPHSGTVIDILRTLGLACVAIGVLVWLCDREKPTPDSAAGLAEPSLGAKMLDVVRATGAAPLTIYTMHILVSGALLHPYFGKEAMPVTSFTDLPWWAAGPVACLLQLALALSVGAVLSATKRRGPLEALLARIVALFVR